ncbi:hypothetical protein EW145_g1937 [Phellinidium pouzarii]|uniref:HTH CENPB-type domain-containing protein n=1 Tax=Phellinidium pouzarii TaxID=167371 RepID=A0A4S4LCV8_9AGAM|nr:hypothetical protein EW145_g1937 [Phellinidium pouzarii]
MGDQHQHQHASYQPYVLDGVTMAIDVDKQQQHGQMSPPSSTDSCPNPIIYNASHANFSATPDPAYVQHEHYGHPGSPGSALTLNPAQLRATAIGPSRVLTRRQARIAQASAHAFASNAHGPQEQQQHFNDNFVIYNSPTSMSRPQTPSRFQTYAEQQRVNLPDLSIGTLNMHHSAGMSPPHPSTPASVTSSSGFSHYGFHHPYASSHSHSRSGSSSTHPRSASPAISVMSAATSLSSASSRPRPPLSSGSLSVASFLTSKPKRRLLNKQRKDICLYFIEHPNSRQEDIAAKWGVERSTVSKILKHKHRWLAVTDGDDQVIAKHRPSKFPEVEMELQDWLQECHTSKTLISDVMIRTKAREVARELGLGEDKFKASAGWVENFKHRQGIKKGIWVGREPIFCGDPSDESEGELLSDLKERRQRERLLLEADILANRAVRPQEHLNVPVITGTDVLGFPSSAKIGWVRPQLTLGTRFGDPPVVMLSMQDNNDASQMNGLNDEQHQQVVIDSQPPPPYPNDNGVTPQGAFVAQGLGFPAPQGSQQQEQVTQMQQFAATWGARTGSGANNGSSTASNPSVNAREAGIALETLMCFLKTKRPDFLTQQEQNIITDIKHLIWVEAAESANAVNAASAAAAAQAAQAAVAPDEAMTGAMSTNSAAAAAAS